MKNDGKFLEQTLLLIQDTFKNSSSTKIFKNYRLENTSQNKREIDVLIVCKVNNFDIKIAIECKDYKNKVKAEQIESFHSKCLRIPSINKKVFVSRKGYQKDAIESAKDFGIELLTADIVSKETILGWLPIKQLRLQLLPEIPEVILTINELKEKIEKTTSTFDGYIYVYKDITPLNIKEFIFNSALDNKKIFHNLAIIEWLRLDENQRLNNFIVPFELKFKNYYIKNDIGEKIRLLKVKSGIMVKFVEREANIIEGRNILGQNNKEIAKSIKVEYEGNSTTDIILDKNQKAYFYITNSQGESVRLKKLFSYDPKSDKFS